jgi:hypothetical protein
MRQITLLAVLVFILFSMAHSEEAFEDVVYLKNGGVIRGMIIEQKIGKFIKIKTYDNRVLVFDFNEVDNIVKEPIQEKNYIEQKTKLAIEQHTISAISYCGILRVGLRYGEDHALFNANFINGAKFGNGFSSGIGLGFDNYPNGNMLPLFLDMRGYFIVKPAILSTYLDAGYSFGWIKNYDGGNFGGLMLALGIGLHSPYNGGLSGFFNIGYKMQSAKEYWTYLNYDHVGNLYDSIEKRTVTYKFITADFGVAF